MYANAPRVQFLHCSAGSLVIFRLVGPLPSVLVPAHLPALRTSLDYVQCVELYEPLAVLNRRVLQLKHGIDMEGKPIDVRVVVQGTDPEEHAVSTIKTLVLLATGKDVVVLVARDAGLAVDDVVDLPARPVVEKGCVVKREAKRLSLR